MTLKVGINGFGRIGRLAARVILNKANIELVGVNDLANIDTLAHLFKYDSAHGQFAGDVSSDGNKLNLGGVPVPVFSEADPTKLPWGDNDVDIVLECTGRFTDYDSAHMHLTAGAKKVIISAPAKGGSVPTFVYGVNHESYIPTEQDIVSNASCTTNCLAPVAKVLNDQFGIEAGLMTTIHSYTNDQTVVDAPHGDLRRARAAAVSQIPTTTGAAKAVGAVLPELNGKLDGMAIRVPTVNVSCVDLVATVKTATDAASVNKALKDAASGDLNGVLAFCEAPLVSVDFMGNTNSSIVDAQSTKVIGNMVKVLSWYDNEIGFCNRIAQLAEYMGNKL